MSVVMAIRLRDAASVTAEHDGAMTSRRAF